MQSRRASRNALQLERRLPHARAACTGPCGWSSCSCSPLWLFSCFPSPCLPVPVPASRRFRNELRVLSPGSLPRSRSLPVPCLPLHSLASQQLCIPCPLPSFAFPAFPCSWRSFLISLAKASGCCTRSPPRKPVSRSSSTWQLAAQQGAAGCTATRGQKQRRDRRAKAHRGREETGPAVDFGAMLLDWSKDRGLSAACRRPAGAKVDNQVDNPPEQWSSRKKYTFFFFHTAAR